MHSPSGCYAKKDGKKPYNLRVISQYPHLTGEEHNPMEKTIRKLNDTTNPDRWKSIIALGEFGEEALEYLHGTLNDDEKWVRYFAADTLGNIGHRSSVDPLIRKLLDDDQDVRWAAASALGRIGDPRAAHALMQAYNSDNCFVKVFIEEALENITASRQVAPGMGIVK
jgi:HEAT repeat protein